MWLGIITLIGIYWKKVKFSCEECNKVYLGEMGHQLYRDFKNIGGLKITNAIRSMQGIF